MTELDFAQYKRDQTNSVVQFRIAQELRDKAKHLATSSSSDSVKVTESDIYRTIVSLFLLGKDMLYIRNQFDNVSENGGEV